MLDKYFKIQRLVEEQKKRREKVEQIFSEILNFLPKFEIDFKNQNTLHYENLNEKIIFFVKVKIKDRSTTKFILKQNENKIKEEYSKIFADDILTLV